MQNLSPLKILRHHWIPFGTFKQTNNKDKKDKLKRGAIKGTWKIHKFLKRNNLPRKKFRWNLSHKLQNNTPIIASGNEWMDDLNYLFRYKSLSLNCRGTIYTDSRVSRKFVSRKNHKKVQLVIQNLSTEGSYSFKMIAWLLLDVKNSRRNVDKQTIKVTFQLS